MYDKHISEQHCPADGSTVADEVEGKLFIQGRINGIIGSNEPECIAIGRGAKDGSHADVPASANPVMTCRPNFSARNWPTIRATVSLAPPAENETIQ